jgi:hypothetical protein
MKGRTDSDEAYVIDLCDRVLNRRALRQHHFTFLRGDTGRTLPVDAYYPDLALAVEYRERQHIEDIPWWNKRQTVSRIPRGEQRAKYDQLRREVLPLHGISLVELNHTDFGLTARKRLLRAADEDERVVREKLTRWLPSSSA